MHQGLVQVYVLMVSCRYYAQQRTTDAISGNMAKDEFKRHGREARERQAEQQLLEEMYVVST